MAILRNRRHLYLTSLSIEQARAIAREFTPTDDIDDLIKQVEFAEQLYFLTPPSRLWECAA